MALRDEIRQMPIEAAMPMARGEPIFPDPHDPETMEDVFRPRPDPLQQPPPMKVRQAANDTGIRSVRSDAVPNSGQPAEPPMPEAGERPRGAEQAQPTALINPDDTRYKDPQNLLIADVITAGSLPWIQAAADVAAGRVPSDQFDAARQEHAQRLQALRDEHPEFVSAAQKAMPFLEGLGMSLMKPAKTMVGTMARGAGVTAPQGAVRGYTGGPIEEPSASTERTARAVGGAAKESALGAAGATVPSIVGGAKSMATTALAARAERKSQETMARKADAERSSTERNQRATEARERNAKAEGERIKDENRQLTEQYAKLRTAPKKVSQHWQENRAQFGKDPANAFEQAAEQKLNLEQFAGALNLPPRVVVNRLSKADFPLDTPEKRKLYNEMLDVDNVWREVEKRGLKPKTPAASTKSAAKAATGAASEPKAAKAPKKAAAPKKPTEAQVPKPRTSKKSNQRSDENPYGEGPYTVKGARKKPKE